MTSNDFPLTLFFDGACPMCRAEMTVLQRRDTAGRLRFADVHAADFAVPAATTPAAMLAAIHGRTADDRLVVGVETLRLAYRAIGLGWLVAPTDWPLLRGASERAYLWAARHRFALPAWLGLAAFALQPRRPDCTDTTCSR
jgi:predicted DCC family thiol-disulfide oxidoreductase YuxK